MAEMFLMCGKCGSGKSYFAKQFAKTNGYRYLGIDECYAILNGDEKIRENKFEAWQLFYKRIHICEELGQTVVIDTNAPFPNDRQEFLNWFPGFEYYTLFWIDSSDENCLRNNLFRSRQIPKDHLEKVNKMFIPPTENEPGGRAEWTHIYHIINTGTEPNINKWKREHII